MNEQVQETSWRSPEMKSRTLRPARSIVRAAISTDRSLTAPTMAASSSGGCRKEATGVEGPLTAAPGPLIPTRCGRVLRPSFLGTLSHRAPISARCFLWSPGLACRASSARVPLLCPPLGPGPAQNPGMTMTCETVLSLVFKSHLPVGPRQARGAGSVLSPLCRGGS